MCDYTMCRFIYFKFVMFDCCKLGLECGRFDLVFFFLLVFVQYMK